MRELHLHLCCLIHKMHKVNAFMNATKTYACKYMCINNNTAAIFMPNLDGVILSVDRAAAMLASRVSNVIKQMILRE